MQTIGHICLPFLCAHVSAYWCPGRTDLPMPQLFKNFHYTALTGAQYEETVAAVQQFGGCCHSLPQCKGDHYGFCHDGYSSSSNFNFPYPSSNCFQVHSWFAIQFHQTSASKNLASHLLQPLTRPQVAILNAHVFAILGSTVVLPSFYGNNCDSYKMVAVVVISIKINVRI